MAVKKHNYIHFENVSVTVPISTISHERSLRQELKKQLTAKKPTEKSITLLDNISLKLENGDRLGLVGSNGAGKSSLLKTLAGIYYPSSGKYDAHGDISCLLDISPGLEPEASGYENILLFCAMENYSPKITKKVVKYVEEFSGLGEHLYGPLRTYSSGMSTRLGFSLITAFDSEILLIDEFFSTGDANFIKKGSVRLKEIIKQSAIFVFASHNLKLLEELCPKSVLIEKGKIISHDDTKKIIKQYEKTSVFNV